MSVEITASMIKDLRERTGAGMMECKAALAEANGLKVVMNRCPKIEYGRLSSEISWMGVNSRTLTSKKARVFGRGIQRMSLNRTTTAGGATAAADRAFREESE